MMKSKKRFAGESEERSFVARCEAEFEERLASAIEKVCATEDLKLIALTGPTCSGKTTTAAKLIENMTSIGRKVHIVSIDDFYLDRDVLLARTAGNPDAAIDYDSEETIDLDALALCIEQIFADVPAMIPKFDFVEGRRVGYTAFDPDDDDLFIFEGIQAIYPKVTELFSHHVYKSIYISVESGIDIEGKVFYPNEIRLMRRLVRDYNFRGACPEFTFYLWESVRSNEEINIFPYAAGCDYFINSTLPFEINMLKPFLNIILEQVPRDSKYHAPAAAMLEKIRDIEEIPQSYISENSLYYEFLKRPGEAK